LRRIHYLCIIFTDKSGNIAPNWLTRIININREERISRHNDIA
jgi:hypothetical protein